MFATRLTFWVKLALIGTLNEGFLPGELQLCTPGSENVIPHPEFCDKYVHCDGGKTSIHECEDGLAYDPPLKTCRPLHTVDCSSRPHLRKIYDIFQGEG